MKTAQAMAQQAQTDLIAIAKARKFRSDTSLDRFVAEQAGLSTQAVRYFRIGQYTNVTVATLDNLVAAIRVAKRMKAA